MARSKRVEDRALHEALTAAVGVAIASTNGRHLRDVIGAALVDVLGADAEHGGLDTTVAARVVPSLDWPGGPIGIERLRAIADDAGDRALDDALSDLVAVTELAAVGDPYGGGFPMFSSNLTVKAVELGTSTYWYHVDDDDDSHGKLELDGPYDLADDADHHQLDMAIADLLRYSWGANEVSLDPRVDRPALRRLLRDESEQPPWRGDVLAELLDDDVDRDDLATRAARALGSTSAQVRHDLDALHDVDESSGPALRDLAWWVVEDELG